MKNALSVSLLTVLVWAMTPTAFAGDCSNRRNVDWHATVSSATNVRIECDDHKGPVGQSVGVVPAGEVIRIVEVDRNREYFVVETSKGRGFIYKTFLKDITESPLPVPEPPLFSDLDQGHRYYDAIKSVKERGIVSGTEDGRIKADDPINRAELAKILVEATSDDEEIEKAFFSTEDWPQAIFSDAEVGAWYLSYLNIARQKGIMTGDKKTGTGPTTVRPGDFANGAEVAKMIAIAFELGVRQAGPDEQWYEPYLEILKGKEALPYSDASHRVTRGEMMFMISQILDS